MQRAQRQRTAQQQKKQLQRERDRKAQAGYATAWRGRGGYQRGCVAVLGTLLWNVSCVVVVSVEDMVVEVGISVDKEDMVRHLLCQICPELCTVQDRHRTRRVSRL